MSLWQAILIGIIQGLTEYLPISSTAHIAVIPRLLGWDDPGAGFTAVIQWGTLIAVIIYFRNDLYHIIRAVIIDTFDNRFGTNHHSRMGWMIVGGTVPIVIFGLLFRHQISRDLRNLYVISASMIGMAIFLLAAEMFFSWRQRRQLKQKEIVDIGWPEAMAMGFAQCIALIPGASRSGVTITAGLFAGLTREAAARFSFLLSLPAVFAAGVLELYKERDELLHSQESIVNLVVSTIVSGVVGYATIAFLLGFLRRHTTYVFVVYRIMLGGMLLILLAKGKLLPALQ